MPFAKKLALQKRLSFYMTNFFRATCLQNVFTSPGHLDILGDYNLLSVNKEQLFLIRDLTYFNIITEVFNEVFKIYAKKRVLLYQQSDYLKNCTQAKNLENLYIMHTTRIKKYCLIYRGCKFFILQYFTKFDISTSLVFWIGDSSY